jgi:ribonuclease BN (tRNA processing enzyme)
VMYSGDSGWTEEFVRRSAGVDLFICECCYYDSRFDFHINYPGLEPNLPRIGAKRLILTHLGREVLAKLDRVKVETATDGMVIDL